MYWLNNKQCVVHYIHAAEPCLYGHQKDADQARVSAIYFGVYITDVHVHAQAAQAQYMKY